MIKLALRPVSPQLAQATRALGAGVTTTFTARGMQGELCLLPLSPDASEQPGTWLNSALGPLHISDAGALLSLLGELPVTVAGETQNWYWQLISQRLSPVLAECLSPLSILEIEAPMAAEIRYAAKVSLGEEALHTQLASSASTLLNWLQASTWRQRHRIFPASLSIRIPLALGLTELTYEQLGSLRPGDVVVPSQERFNCEGTGVVDLAGRYWNAQTRTCGKRLLLNLATEINNHE